MIRQWRFLKARLAIWAYEHLQTWLMRDFEIRDLIFNAAFEGLKTFVESGRMGAKEWNGADAIGAEFELEQCYAWFTKVRPFEERGITTLEKLEEFEADNQKYLERLIKVSGWLR